MLRFMNAPDPIPPFHRQPEASEGQPLPRSITRVDSGPVQIDRVAALVHELDNLLDGSLRCVSLAVRTLNAQPGQVGLGEIDSVRHQLETAAKALERMAGLVHAAMRGRSYTIGSLTTDSAPTVTLRDAIEHAADVMRLAAQQHHSAVHVDIDTAIADCPAGPIYSALLNGIKNAVESVAAAGGRGSVNITCRVEATSTVRSRAAGSTQRWVRINIIDDGAGINTEVLLAKARERGIVGPDETPTDDAIRELIFHAGFSTAKELSDVSGRGVGMDVVRRNITELGGAIELESTVGVGTTIRIRLPLTLAILDGQLVRVGDQTYIVPLVSIVESLQATPDRVKSVTGNAELYRLRGEYLPVIRLYELFGIPPQTTALEQGLLVVVEGEGRRASIFVDELLGQQQVVIKSLETNYRKVDGISGATILGDGTVAMIIDAGGVIALARKPQAQRVEEQPQAA